ncbi:MAG: hypothetical protein PHV08_06945 [Sulfurovaceae bacterium]|nr:hypothetical protein [Sulfurovaceae bacterium]
MKKQDKIKNFMMAIALGVLTLGSIVYYSIENSKVEVALSECQQSKQDIKADEAKSRRGDFDYKRANDGSDKLTY